MKSFLMSKGYRRYVRVKKAEIRRTVKDSAEQAHRIAELYAVFETSRAKQ